MRFISDQLQRLPGFSTLLQAIGRGELPAALSGLSAVHRAAFIYAIVMQTGRGACVLTSDEAAAESLSADLKALGLTDVLLYPARDFAFQSAGSSHEYEQQRIDTLSHCLEGATPVIVAPVDAAMQATLTPDALRQRILRLAPGTKTSPAALAQWLLAAGYARFDQVESAGQFSVRGGIVDLYAPGQAAPARIEFWGDEIDRICAFDIDSQRRGEELEEIRVVPAVESALPLPERLLPQLEAYLAQAPRLSDKRRACLQADIDALRGGLPIASDAYLSFWETPPGTLFDYMEGALLFACDSEQVFARARRYDVQMAELTADLLEQGRLSKGQDHFGLDTTELETACVNAGVIYMDTFSRSRYATPVKTALPFALKQTAAWSGMLSVLLDDLTALRGTDMRCVVLAGEERAARALAEELRGNGVAVRFDPDPTELGPGICVTTGGLSAGFELPQARFLLITHGQARAVRRRRKARRGEQINSLEEIKVGDYIVHTAHGIGIFDGVHCMTVHGVTKDYIKIRYLKNDVLYVPVTQLDLVSRYIGPREDAAVKLNRLGGEQWNRTRRRVRAAVKDMAKHLAKLYAARMSVKGFAFSPDTDMQNDFERRFEYEETEDQLRCAQEIKQDMERIVPMDRLLCGDVGFGKTEVALRAAFKCIADGKQCAILVPTTILALQHYQTAVRRFSGMPVEIEMLSRFRTAAQQAEILKKLRRGRIDLLIGTHRLISNDVVFHDLGLVVVDEEQRFGVVQKEKLKEKYPTVDVLTLSATPIPRTLNMAMTGLRDMSSIEEAPQDRHPVQTYVIEQDNGVLLDAIRKELRRGGQVYYLHNRVDSMSAVANRLQIALPDSRIALAHGKMDEKTLSEVWRQLLEHEIDILVCTTIIETGVDVPNVNTMIIEDADRMGLSQLHQLRGRIGRSSRRAYAYFCFRRGRALSDVAAKRLSAIREYTEFGSGFKIAMRDLEIRGAGNILGGEQHGHMEAVGYELYLRMLADAVAQEKGEPAQPEIECVVDLPVAAHIPNDYIESLAQRMGVYRRIAEIRTRADAQDVRDELRDRFGPPPEVVEGLIDIALLRSQAAKLQISEIAQREDGVTFYMPIPRPQILLQLVSVFGQRVSVGRGAKSWICLKLLPGQSSRSALHEVVDLLQAFADESSRS